MDRFGTGAFRFGRCAASIVFILIALHLSAFAQGAQAPGPCDGNVPAVTDATLTLSPKRGWQMTGRDIELTITSSNLTSNPTVRICFGWKRKQGKMDFEQADSVRILQRPLANQTPPTMRVATVVPVLAGWPLPDDQDALFTPEEPPAAIADVRVLLVGTDGKPLEVFTTQLALVGPNEYCSIPRPGRTDIGSVSASKNWQPLHGEIEFTAKTFNPLPSDLTIRTCFRWTLHDYADIFSDSENIRILDRQANAAKLAVTVPDFGNEPSRFSGKRVGYFGIPYLLMPKMTVRVLFLDSASLDPVLDAWTVAWVTDLLFGVAMAALVVGGSFLVLWLVCRRRFAEFGKINPLLCVISTRSGYASLSQFQIMLWTFLVVGSVAYVIALSGTLITITGGTLVLLGISGVTAVIAKAKNENEATARPLPLDSAAAKVEAARAEDDARRARAIANLAAGDEDAQLAAAEETKKAEVAKAKAEAAEASLAAVKARDAVATAVDKDKAETHARDAEAEAENKRKVAEAAAADAAVTVRLRHPLWSDLVMGQSGSKEIDVARVQMLCFTLVTAAFVAVKVATSYEIPVIPEGYLILMGISNGVYVGSTMATSSGR